jgi:hypothetical protein
LGLLSVVDILPRKGIASRLAQMDDDNVEKIMDDITGNFELQGYVMACIAEYKQVKRAAQDQSKELGEIVEESLAKKRRTSEYDPDTPPAGLIERFMFIYSRWGPQHVKRLIDYCEPGLRDLESQLFKNKQVMSQVLEYGWDLRIVGKVLDKVYCNKFDELYPSLNAAYLKKGQPLEELGAAHEVRRFGLEGPCGRLLHIPGRGS